MTITSHASRTMRILDWFTLRLSQSVNIDGLWVGVFSERRGSEILARIGEALELIKTYDPYRYKRVQREIERLLVELVASQTAVFVPALRRCVIDPRYVLSSTPEFIASAIVHEATHGRLIRRKIGYSEALRHRVEKVCLRQERCFAQKIPQGEVLRQSIEICLGLAPDYWTNAVVTRRHLEGEIAMARYAGIPNWLLMTLLRVRKFRSGRQSAAPSK